MPIDQELTKALKLARQNKMFFVFVAKGSAEGKLIVQKRTIPPRLISEAKAEIGGGTPFKGLCYGEEGVMIFEMEKQPPSSLTNHLKRVIREDAGLNLKVEIRVADGLFLRDLESTEAEGSESSET
jgi:hypothetical protein